VVVVAVYWMLPARGADGVNVAVLPLTLTRPLTAVPSEVFAKVKLALVSVAFVIASEKVADTEEFSATPIAPFAGDVADTIGGVVSGTAPVVKFQLKSAASALPAESVAPVVMVAVCGVIAANGAEGVKVAELLVATTVPVIGKPACVASLKVPVVSVDFNMTSEKVAVIAEFTAISIAAFAGEVEDTVGGVVSAASVVADATFEFPETFPAASTARTV
jgi:hypothetical protein